MESSQMRMKQTVRGLAAILVLAATAMAQGDIRTITHIQVKRDRLGDFQAAVREMVELYKKSGSARGFTVWSSSTGPFEFVVVSW